ncbi:glycosyltransferase family 4 protein [Aerolutibacter daejeonensis]|nr:glycosyltransferase family 4 protein [Lysobacter daejeonensis]
MRNRVLLITRNLPPLRGGMERLNLHLVSSLVGEYEVAIVGPTGCAAHLPAARRDCSEVPHRPLLRFMLGALWASFRLAWRARPLIVLAGSGLTAPIAWLVARLAGARCIVYVHGLDLVATHPVYRVFWLPFIRHADMVLANSVNTAQLAMRCGVTSSRVSVLHPGTKVPGHDSALSSEFRAIHGFGDRPILLSVGRLTPRKGLVEFVLDVFPEVLKAQPDALLVVIGADAHDALSSVPGSQCQRIRDAAVRAGIDHALHMLPPCSDATLAMAYCSADVHVFPIRSVPGDVEGFGMVAIEAAAHGLPTVAFAVGGVADAVVEGRSGSLVAEGDYLRFADKVVEWISRREDRRVASACIEAARLFSWERFGKQLRANLV